MYTYRHAFQGVVRPCKGQSASSTQSEPDHASGMGVIPRRCRGNSQIGRPIAGPRKYSPSTGPIRL